MKTPHRYTKFREKTRGATEWQEGVSGSSMDSQRAP